MTSALLTAAAFLVVMVVGGTRVLPAVLRRVLVWGSRELFLVAVVAVGVGTGYVAYRLGLSFALGAFIAGVVLSESELSHQALADVVPLRDVFALLFFVSVGMLFDPRYLADNAGLVATTVVILIVGKALICGLVARAFGYVFSAPWLVGLGLAQVGEFSFVLARAGLETGALTQSTYDLALSCTVVSMTLSPAVLALALPLYRLSIKGRAPQKARRDRPARDGRTPRPRGGGGLWPYRARRGGGAQRGRCALGGHRPSAYGARRVGARQLRLGRLAAPRKCSRPPTSEPRGHWSWRSPTGTRRNWPSSVPFGRIRDCSWRLERRRSNRVQALRNLGVAAAVQPEVEGGIEMMRQTLRSLDRDHDAIERLTQDVRERFYAPNS